MLLSALRCEKGAIEHNLAEHRRVLEEARDTECALAVFPEMSLTGSVDPTQRPERLIGLDHPAVAALTAATDELGVAAVFGIAEAAADGTACITQAFAERGRLAGVQRKRHLGEDEIGYDAADEDAVFELDGVRFTVAICAEGEIERPFAHAQSAGAAFVCFSAAPGLWERKTTDEEWRLGWEWWCGHGLRQAREHAPRTRPVDRDRGPSRLDRRRRFSRPRRARGSPRRGRDATPGLAGRATSWWTFPSDGLHRDGRLDVGVLVEEVVGVVFAL